MSENAETVWGRPDGLMRRFTALRQRLLASDLIHKVIETFATRIVLLVVSIVTSILITRLLGPEGRGVLAVASTISAIGIQFGDLGLSSAHTFFVAKDRSLLPRLTGNTLFVSFGMGTAGILLLVLLARVWSGLLPVHGLPLLLALTTIPFGLSAALLLSLLMGVQDVRGYNKAQLFNAILTLALIAALGLLHRMSAAVVLGITLLVAAINFTLLLRRLHSHIPERFRFVPSLLRQTVGYGFRFYLANFFAMMVLRSDMILVDARLGERQAGFYSVAVTLANLLYILPNVVGSLLFPRLTATQDMAARWHTTRKAMQGVTAAVGLSGLLCCLLAAPFVRLAFGTAFLAAVPSLLWLLPGMLFQGLSSVLSAYVGSVKIPWSLILIYAAAFVLNLTLNLLFLSRYGIVAASLNSSLCYGLSLLALWLWFARPMQQRGAAQ